MKKPLLLMIIDGLGINEQSHGNAWKNAKTPNLDRLLKTYPHTRLKAAGQAVGLPDGQMGNSEVGHLNIGAGQIVYTGLSLIAKAIADQTFAHNLAFAKVIEHVQTNQSTLHVMGLLSPGGVHSLEEHLYAILDMLHAKQVSNVVLHIFGDGRDVAPQSIKSSLTKLLQTLATYNYHLGSIQGRLYAMDRDAIFEKTTLAYEGLRGQAQNQFTDALAYIDSQYAKGKTDEFLEVAINAKLDKNLFLRNHDGVIFFNFRPDRARQLAHLLVSSKLYEAKPSHPLADICLVSMMKYEGIDKALVAFDAMEVSESLGSILAKHHKTQLRLAETQKYAHVTFFMDGGLDVEFPGEKRLLIPSLKIENFAEAPAMSAREITASLVKVIHEFDVIIMNYANPDMVGHTGDLQATIKAVEVIDEQIGIVEKAINQGQGVMFITADHGNAEVMLDEQNHPVTKHTTSDVPLIITNQQIKLQDQGSLANITPTILDYLNIPKPACMTAKSLIVKVK